MHSLLLAQISGARKRLEDGSEVVYPVDIPVCCEHILQFLWIIFQFTGHPQFHKVIAASKEIMSFHDNDPVLC